MHLESLLERVNGEVLLWPCPLTAAQTPREPAACSCSALAMLQSPPIPALAMQNFNFFCPPPPSPADWWLKVGMWSTQMSGSRRSLFRRIISLTTHFSLPVSWLGSSDLPVCLVQGLTAAALLGSPWCILFSFKLIRGVIAYSIGPGEEGEGYESCTLSEEKDFLLSGINFGVF